MITQWTRRKSCKLIALAHRECNRFNVWYNSFGR